MRSGFFDAHVLGYDEFGNPQFDRAESAGFLASFVSGFIRSGVSPDWGRLAVVPGDGMQVLVSAGKCIINGYFGWVEEPEALTIAPADSLLNRIDTVVLRLDLVGRVIALDVVQGVSAAVPTPTAPVRPVDGLGDVYELVLAQVSVPANSARISTENIFDTRADPDLCGWITSPLTEPERVPSSNISGSVVSLHLSKTAEYNLGTLDELTLSAARPENGIYYAYSINFNTSGDLVFTVPDGWVFVGQDCSEGIFTPANNASYEMIGAWRGDVLRWVVVGW